MYKCSSSDFKFYGKNILNGKYSENAAPFERRRKESLHFASKPSVYGPDFNGGIQANGLNQFSLEKSLEILQAISFELKKEKDLVAIHIYDNHDDFNKNVKEEAYFVSYGEKVVHLIYEKIY